MGLVRRLRRFLTLVAAATLVACSGANHRPVVPRHGGVLRLALPPIGTLDPAQAVTGEQRLLATALFMPLTRYDQSTLAVLPGVASSWSSTDQRRWTFTLGDAHFSDGRTVSGLDVAFTLTRIARKGSGSAVADLLSGVHGFSAVANGAASTLAGVQVLPNRVVRITLDRPWAELPSVLANPAFGVVPRTYGRTPASGDPTVTSGPFTLDGRAPGRLTLHAVAGGSALLDGIAITTFSDPTAAYQAFVNGTVDWALVPPAFVAEAARRYGRTGYAPLAAELFYGFNLRDPAFADLRFRRAIVQAVHGPAVAAAAYRGSMLPFTGLVVAGFPGHQADPCGAPCVYDTASARSLIAQAFPGSHPPTLAIDFDQDPTQRQVALTIQSQLAAVGVTATLRPHALAEYQKFVSAGRAQLFRLGWVAEYAAPDAFLTPLFRSGLTTNPTGLASPAVDRALAGARAESDPARRLAGYQQAERLILAQLPVIPIAQFQTHSVISRIVRGLTVSALGTFDPATVWLSRG